MNPNEYDDDTFLEASNRFQSAATAGFEALHKAGCSSANIVDEINNALAEAGINNQRGDGPLTLTDLDD